MRKHVSPFFIGVHIMPIISKARVAKLATDIVHARARAKAQGEDCKHDPLLCELAFLNGCMQSIVAHLVQELGGSRALIEAAFTTELGHEDLQQAREEKARHDAELAKWRAERRIDH